MIRCVGCQGTQVTRPVCHGYSGVPLDQVKVWTEEVEG